MKREYELSLKRNKVINVFKYVVFIIAFMVVWMIGENSIVSAGDCLGIDKSYVADVTCNTDVTGVRDDEIRIMQGKEVHFPLNNNLARLAIAVICRYDSDDDCVWVDLHDNTNGSNNIVQSDLKIKRDGTIYFDFKIGTGDWYKSDHGEWKKIDKNLKDVILENEEEYQYNSKGFRLYLSLKKSFMYQTVYQMYINVGPYYFTTPYIKVSEMDGNTSVIDQYRQSHKVTIEVENAPAEGTIIQYCVVRKDSDKSFNWVRYLNDKGVPECQPVNNYISHEITYIYNASTTTVAIDSYYDNLFHTYQKYNGEVRLYVSATVNIHGHKSFIELPSRYQTLLFDNEKPSIDIDVYDDALDVIDDKQWYKEVYVEILYEDTYSGIAGHPTTQFCISSRSDKCEVITDKVFEYAYEYGEYYAPDSTDGWYPHFWYDLGLWLRMRNNEGSFYVHAKACDNITPTANCTVKYSSTKINIDTKGPVLESVSSTGDNIKNANDTITVKYNDKGIGIESDVAGIYYCWFKNFFQDYCENLKMQGDTLSMYYPFGKSGMYYLWTMAYDSLGNQGDLIVHGAYFVDSKAPTGGAIVSVQNAEGGWEAPTSTNNAHSKYKISLEFTDTDDDGGTTYASGVKSYTVKMCVNKKKCADEEAYHLEMSTEDGVYVVVDKDTIMTNAVDIYFVYYFEDNEGNNDEMVAGPYILDTKPPSINIGSKSQLKPKLDTGASTVMLSMQSNVTKVVEEVEVNEAHVIEEVEQVKEVVEVMPVVNEVSVVNEKEVARLDKIEMHVVDRAICEIKCSIMLGGTYLFGKRRKRINVC